MNTSPTIHTANDLTSAHSGSMCNPVTRVIGPALISRLHAVPDLDLYLNVDLSQYSRWKIGGYADCVACPRTKAALQQIIRIAGQSHIPVAVIGFSSNLLFAQEGIRALIIHLGRFFSAMAVCRTHVWAQAGIWVPQYARTLSLRGLTGIEHLAGIPGTLGGLICMNGGSQRQGIGDRLRMVTALDMNGEFHSFRRDQCEFAYRTSIFQHNQHIITDACFEYETASDPAASRAGMKRILEQRRRKFPQKLPNCGSVFVSNPELYERFGPPGALIEQCGLKGTVRGGAEISRQHGNFIINRGGATSADVLYLIDLIRTTVRLQTGLDMVAEAKYVDPLGRTMPAHIAAERLRDEGRL